MFCFRISTLRRYEKLKIKTRKMELINFNRVVFNARIFYDKSTQLKLNVCRVSYDLSSKLVKWHEQASFKLLIPPNLLILLSRSLLKSPVLILALNILNANFKWFHCSLEMRKALVGRKFFSSIGLIFLYRPWSK